MKTPDITIRREQPDDYGEVYALVRTAFAAEEHADGDEADYLNELRTKDTFIPALSLVAALPCGRVVGQVVLYETEIATRRGPCTQLLLSPICVHPEHQRRGIARALVEAALAKARAMGYGAVFLCGDPAIYSRLGFVPSYQFRIYHAKKRYARWSMVRELTPGALRGIRGTVDTI